MRFLNNTKEFGKEDDEKTDGDDGRNNEFLSSPQLHGECDIQSMMISVTLVIVPFEMAFTSCDLGLKTSNKQYEKLANELVDISS